MTWPAVAQAVRPTAHALVWTPLLAVASVLLAFSVAVRLLDGDPGPYPLFAVALLAGVTLVAIEDPAARLLAPVPVPVLVRRMLRMALVLAPATLALVVVTALLPGEHERLLAPGLALTLTGLAVASWLPPDRGVHLAAAIPVIWVSLHLVLGALFGVAGPALGWWHTETRWVSAVALVAIALGSRR